MDKKETKRIYDVFIPSFELIVQDEVEEGKSIVEALEIAAEVMLLSRDRLIHTARELRNVNVTLDGAEEFVLRLVPQDAEAIEQLEGLSRDEDSNLSADDFDGVHCTDCGEVIDKEQNAKVMNFPKLNSVPEAPESN